MSADQIREALEAATAYLQEHPDEARSTDSAARASLVDGLVVRVTGPGGEGITTDMGAVGWWYGHGAFAWMAPPRSGSQLRGDTHRDACGDAGGQP